MFGSRGIGVSILLLCAFLAVTSPAHGIQQCDSEWHHGSVAWVFAETEIWIVIMEPGLGNNLPDCIANPFTCETLRCDTIEESGFDCKEAPVSHCIDYLVEQCLDPTTIAVVRQIELSGIGPCE